MFTITRHIPNCCSTPGMDPPPEKVTFSNLEELKKIKFVHNFMSDIGSGSFYQLSISSHSQYGINSSVLMAEYDEGKVWWGVGYLTGENLEKLNLPKWVRKV